VRRRRPCTRIRTAGDCFLARRRLRKVGENCGKLGIAEFVHGQERAAVSKVVMSHDVQAAQLGTITAQDAGNRGVLRATSRTPNSHELMPTAQRDPPLMLRTEFGSSVCCQLRPGRGPRQLRGRLGDRASRIAAGNPPVCRRASQPHARLHGCRYRVFWATVL